MTTQGHNSVFLDESHFEQARDFIDLVEPHFSELSRLQIAYIAAVATDPRLGVETKSMLTCVAILAGPDLKKTVTDEELYDEMNRSVSGAARLLLSIMEPEGHA